MSYGQMWENFHSKAESKRIVYSEGTSGGGGKLGND